MELAHILKTFVSQQNNHSFHFGVITSHKNTSPKSVSMTLSGSDVVLTNIRYIHSYSPSVGDTVLVLSNHADLIVLGDLVD